MDSGEYGVYLDSIGLRERPAYTDIFNYESHLFDVASVTAYLYGLYGYCKVKKAKYGWRNTCESCVTDIL